MNIDTFYLDIQVGQANDMTLGTGVPRHRDGIVQPYVRMYVFNK